MYKSHNEPPFKFKLINSHKGRQTWCPFTQQSLSSASANNNMAEFFTKNLGIKAFSCLEWLQAFCTCCEKDTLVYKTAEIYTVKKSYPSAKHATRQRTFRYKEKRRMTWKRREGREACYRFMMDLTRTFAHI